MQWLVSYEAESSLFPTSDHPCHSVWGSSYLIWEPHWHRSSALRFLNQIFIKSKMHFFYIFCKKTFYSFDYVGTTILGSDSMIDVMQYNLHIYFCLNDIMSQLELLRSDLKNLTCCILTIGGIELDNINLFWKCWEECCADCQVCLADNRRSARSRVCLAADTVIWVLHGSDCDIHVVWIIKIWVLLCSSIQIM